MGRYTACAVAFGLSIVAHGVQADAPAPAIHRFVLGNGMKVVVEPAQQTTRAFVMVRYDSGAGDDPAGFRGLTHVTEHLSFGSGKVQAAWEDLGSTYYNGVTSLDETYYFEHVAAAAVERAVWQESARMAFLLDRLTERDVAHEQRIVTRELHERTHGSAGVGEAAARELFPAGHPYHFVRDDADDIAAIRLPHVQWYAQSVYRPERATLVVTGGVEPAQVHAWAERYFGAVRSSSPPGERARPASLGPLSRACTVQSQHQTVDPAATLAWRTPPRTHDDSPVLDVIAALLEGPRQARLTRALTQADGPASTVRVFHSPLRLGGVMEIDVHGRRGEQLDPMLARIDLELRAIADGALEQGELEAARTYALRRFDRQAHALVDRALALATARDDDALTRDRRVVEHVTLRDVRRVARRWLDPRRRVLVRTDCKACARERTRCEEVAP